MFCRNCGKDVVETAEMCPACGARPLAGKSFCPACGSPTTELSEMCTKCGTRLKAATPVVPAAPVAEAPAALMPEVPGGPSPKLRLTTTLLAAFVGQLGVHRLYVGRKKSGLTMLLLNILLGIPLFSAGWSMAMAGAGVGGNMGLALAWGGWAMLGIGGLIMTVIAIIAFTDFIMAAIGKFKDRQGRLIVNWTNK